MGQERSESDRGSKCVEGEARKDTLLVPLGRFWGPSWDPAGRQGAPKISQIYENGVQGRVSEKA